MRPDPRAPRDPQPSSPSSALTGAREAELALRFAARFSIDLSRPPVDVLREVVRAFSRFPYENLTKIIQRDLLGSPAKARRSPREVIEDHERWGAGGTCFSLTHALLTIIRALGWRAEPILADRRYGDDTHCALLVRIDEEPSLLDPGFLILEPLPLPAAGEERRVETSFNRLILRARGVERLDLFTEEGGREKYRLTFKTSPADEAAFLRAWDASFDWEMMTYPLLTRLAGGRQLYLQGARFQERSRDAVSRREVAPDRLVETIRAGFGVDARLVARALRILARRGEGGGRRGGR